MKDEQHVISKIKDTLIKASTTFSDDKKKVLSKLIKQNKSHENGWIIKSILANALVAEKNKIPLCDDTGIPHVILELGKNSNLTYDLIKAIQQGVKQGLKELPGRPMAVKGDDTQRLEQSQGLYKSSGAIAIAPIQVIKMKGPGIKVHILMQGGGPEIRAKTSKIFHEHKISVIIEEIVNWATEGARLLGCTPCTPTIGLGRTHYEATSLMLEAMIKGNFTVQNNLEKEITSKLNKTNIGPLGLSGWPTALATFLQIGPQRASGIRVASLRLCCLAEPRKACCTL